MPGRDGLSGRRGLAAGVAWVLVASLVTLLPVGPAAGAGVTFDPLPDATAVENGVHASVLTDGAGTFHSVMREDGPAQSIVYRRSSDGGRTWAPYARWSGEAGGATEPVMAVSGQRVAIMFLGGYCEGSLCGRAPYLVGSTDAGASFGAPVRMANNASAVAIGIDGGRTWAAWQMRNKANDDVVVLKGYGPTFELLKETAIRGYSPRIAAGGGGGVLTLVREEVVDGQRQLVPTAQLLDGDGLGKREDLAAAPVDAAVAEGRVHLLFREGRNLLVRSAPVSGTAGFGGRVLALVGDGGSIVARPGLVAVGAVDQASGVTVVARSADGASFDRPREVATTKDRPYRVELAAAILPADQPTIALGWSVPSRYADRDGDGYPDPANSGLAPTLPVTPALLEVTVDACASRAGEGATLSAGSYRWTRDGKPLEISGCTGTVEVAEGQSAVIGLEVTDSNGGMSARTIDVTPEDHLVVSLGDSVASGEGNPHADAGLAPARGEVWEDGPCHRTHFAGPALAAQKLEQADPHSSVTFVQLACSGAAIMDVPEVPGEPVDGSDENTGGVLDGYHGVEPDGSGARPSQLEQMTALIGDRTPDAVTISIGANDVVFSDVLLACLTGECLVDGTKAVLDQRLADLPRRYAALGDALAAAKVPDEAVFLTEYYDVASNALGMSDLKCVVNSDQATLYKALFLQFPTLRQAAGPLADQLESGTGIVTDDEAAWSKEYLGARINEEVRAGAQAQGWRVVGGFDSAFARHGYCASDPWIVTLLDTFETQADKNGAFHPNRAGHAEYGRRLGAALIRSLVTVEGSAPSPSALPVGDLYVVTSGTGEATVAAIRDEGRALVPLGQRTLDRVATGSGYVAGLAPAADGNAAVATWTQLAQGSVMTWRSLLAQVALRENIALTSASFSQGAERGSALVPGRPTTVLARFRIDTAGPLAVEVGVTVTDDTTGDVVSSETEQFRLDPGHGIAALPVADVLVPEPGHTYSARVTVKDPDSAGPVGAADNVLEISSDDFPALVPTRPLDLVAVPLLVEGGEVDCADMMARLPSWAKRASAMMPVANEVNLEGGCATVGASLTGDPIPATDKGIAQALVTLDYLARITGRDGVVGVVPAGWLRQVRPIIGIAMMNSRGLIVDVASSESTFAHELTHTMGLDHLEASAAGVWLERRQIRQGVDYMAANDAPDWVSRRTWDGLFAAIGGPEFAPRPPASDAKGLWVRGWVYPFVDDKGETRWAPTPATWVRAEGGTDVERDMLLETLTVSFKLQQLDSSGAPLGDAQPVGLGPVDGRYVRGAQHEEPATYGYNTRVEPLPGAAELVLTMTDDSGTREVDRRRFGAAPSVVVDAPTAGFAVGRGEFLEVAWTAADVDTSAEDLRADLLVSGDDGATWVPLGTDVGASPATVTVPADLDGDRVKVRVVVSDGVQTGVGDSAAFAVGSSASEIRDRVAFTRNGYWTQGPPRLHLMDPDGEAQYAPPLPTTQDWSGPPQRDANGNPIGYQCDSYRNPDNSCAPGYLDPAWSSDGKRLYFSSDLIRQEFGGAAQPGVLDRITTHLWSMAADGTDLKRVTAPQTSPQIVKPAPYSVTNRCVDAGSDRIVWFGEGSVYDGFTYTAGPRESIWAAGPDGNDQRRVFGWDVASRTNQAAWPRFDGAGWEGPAAATSVVISLAKPFQVEGIPGSCPKLSPDGTQVAFPALVTRVFPSKELAAQAVLVVGSDGSGLRVVTDHDGRIPSDDLYAVDWADDSTLVVTRREPRGSTLTPCTLYSYSSRQYDLSTQTPTKGDSTPVQNECAAPAHRRVNPDGLLYGELASQQRLADWNMGVLDPGAPGGLRRVGSDTDYDTQFAWGRQVIGAGGPNLPLVTQPDRVTIPGVDAGGPYSATAGVPLVLTAGGSVLAGDALASVAWDLDGDGQFDDADGRNPEVVFPQAGTVEVRARVTPGSGTAQTSGPSVVTVVEAPDPVFEVDPGATGSPVAPPQPVDLRVEIPAGQPYGVRLGSAEGPLVPWVVVGFDADVLSVRSGEGALAWVGLPTAGATGLVEVVPADGFRGTTRMTYAHPDDLTRTATVEVVVTGNAPPQAGEDALAVDVDVAATIPVAQLLANDSDPDGPQGELRVVSVTGMTAGQAWLTADADQVVLRADRAGEAEFGYVVADRAGGIGRGRVVVTVRGGGTMPPGGGGTTPPPTSPPPTSPPPTSPPTVTPPQAPPDLAPVVTATASGKVYFAYKSVKLSKAEKRKLRRMLAGIPEGASVVLTRSVGVVKAKGATRADQRRALRRAEAVRDYLLAQGVAGPIKASNGGRTSGTSAKARRVNLTITYMLRP